MLKAIRKLKRILMFRGGERKIKMDLGFYIFIDPYLNGVVDCHLAKSGSWEPELIGVFKRHLKRGSTILDIGCNIGFHSLAIAAILNDDCEIHAFEPQLRLVEQFKKSVCENSYRSITIHNVGLSDNNSFLKLELYDGNIGASSFLARDNNKRSKIEVEVKRLDDFGLSNCDFLTSKC